MNLAELKELLELIAERDITEFELEEEGVKLRIRKGRSVDVVQSAAPVEGNSNSPPGPTASSPSAGSEETSALEEGLSLIKAPMVGTFYRQSAPGAEPFAREGDRVTSGQVLCIIEAMKLMNEIESDLSGELVEIYVEDGQPVQYGDKLFAVRES